MISRMLTRGAFLAAATLALTLPGTLPVSAADSDVIKLIFNPNIYDSLPLMLAVDRGYFTDQHLDVQVTKTPQSMGVIIPLLARGDVDVAPTIMAPSFFNQFTGGFGIKVLASMDESRKGWNDTVWIMVREDVWDAKTVQTLPDLKGKSLPKAVGTPVDYIMLAAVAKAGLTPADVTMTHAISGPTDLLPAMKNKLYDVLGVQEPLVTVAEKQGLAHRWLGYQDIIPSYQSAYIASSATFAKNHRDALQRFMVAYLKACRDIDATGGKWTPEMIDTIVKWSGQPREVIAAIPGPAFPGLGTVNVDSINRQQQMWIAQKMLDKPVPVAETVDTSFLTSARKTLGIK
jgi:NitT/TauT family transport system substrate-binding protein